MEGLNMHNKTHLCMGAYFRCLVYGLPWVHSLAESGRLGCVSIAKNVLFKRDRCEENLTTFKGDIA